MIRVVVDGKEKWFNTETQALDFYLKAVVEDYITVYDKDGNEAYGAVKGREVKQVNG